MIDFNHIKQILEIESLPDSVKQSELIKAFSKDKNVFENLLKMLSEERQESEELICNLNLLLSKAYLVIKVPELNKKEFIQKEIKEFWSSNNTIPGIGNCFNE